MSLLNKKTVDDINVKGQKVLVRCDFNVPLKNGVIRASCHDVVKFEPMREDCPLFGIENCYITPHVAWAGSETRQRLVNICAKNIECFISGNPQNVVNK